MLSALSSTHFTSHFNAYWISSSLLHAQFDLLDFGGVWMSVTSYLSKSKNFSLFTPKFYFPELWMAQNCENDENNPLPSCVFSIFTIFLLSQIHSGEKNYKCEFCSKKFLLKHHLHSHLKICPNRRPKVHVRFSVAKQIYFLALSFAVILTIFRDSLARLLF